MVYPIELKNKDQIKNISDLAARQSFPVWLSSSTSMLDARSLLGVYSLIGQKVNVVVEDDVD